MLMAGVRLGLPLVFVFGGPSLPGHLDGNDISIQEVFEAVGAESVGNIDARQLERIERHACPGPRLVRTECSRRPLMAAVAEGLGLSLPGSAAAPATSADRAHFARFSGEAVVRLLEAELDTRKIVTRAALENAAAVGVAVGGSTNIVLHLLAIAHEARVAFALDDIEAVSRRTPQLADVRPAARFLMSDLHRVGGIPVVMRELLEQGLIDGDAL